MAALNSSTGLGSLGALGLIISCLPPHAREFVKQAVAMTLAASVAKRDRPLGVRAVEKAFAEIEVAGQLGDSYKESEAWLRRQLESLDGGGRA